MIIGVDEEGGLVGAPADTFNRLNSYIGAIISRPTIKTEKMKLSGKEILMIEVTSGPLVHRFGEDIYIRVGSSTRKASPEEIASMFAERAVKRFDEAVREDLSYDNQR